MLPFFARFAAGVSLLLAGTAFASAQPYEASLSYWSSYGASETQAEVLREAADAFTKANPGVTINFTFNGRDNYQLLPTAIEAGRDIQMFDGNSQQIVSTFNSFAGSVEPWINAVYPWTDGKAYVDYTMPAMVALARETDTADTIRFVPMNPQAVMWFGNKTILEKSGVTTPPGTWAEFLDACQKIKTAGYTPITTDPPYVQIILGYYLSRLKGEQFVKDLVAGENGVSWTDPAVLQAAQAIEALATNQCFAQGVDANVWPAGQQDLVIGENIALYLNGTWLPNEVQDSTAEGFQWTAFAFPSVDGGVDDATHLAYGSYGIGVNATNSEAQNAAAVAFATFVNTEFDDEMATIAKAIPVGPTAAWPAELVDARAVFLSATGKYAPQTSISANRDLTPVLQTALMKLIAGQSTAADFVAEMAQ